MQRDPSFITRFVSKRARRGRSPQQLGLAMVEGLLTCTALVSLLALGMLLHRQRADRLAAAQQARSARWSAAFSDCDRPSEVPGLLASALREGPPLRPDRFVPTAPLPSAPGMWPDP